MLTGTKILSIRDYGVQRRLRNGLTQPLDFTDWRLKPRQAAQPPTGRVRQRVIVYILVRSFSPGGGLRIWWHLGSRGSGI